jgi:tricorn protease
VDDAKSTQLTDGMSDARDPVWDKDGKYLYFTASTDSGASLEPDIHSAIRPYRATCIWRCWPRTSLRRSRPKATTRKAADEKKSDEKKDEAKKDEAKKAGQGQER